MTNHTIPKTMYAIHPGDVISRGDGQAHFIGYEQLIRLYGVNPTMCVKARNGWDRTYSPEFRQQFVHLYPRYDGKYQVDGFPNLSDDRAKAGGLARTSPSDSLSRMEER